MKRRVAQHLINRDSSVTTGTSPAGLNPDHVTQVRWWEHPDFASKDALEAAELVAFSVLDPVLKSRGAISERAKELQSDAAFVRKMRSLFSKEPTGHLYIPTLEDAMERIADLESRIVDLEKRLRR